jgi:SAM-dependent methyltransferase
MSSPAPPHQDADQAPLAAWLSTPPGRYLLAWEQAQLDRVVADVFGFHALQLGLPELDALRANRMPHRWVALDRLAGDGTPPRAIALLTQGDALPFDERSLDLVVLPHALELARDPHQTLAEVERVLMPEGRVVILGFNAASLWGLRQRGGRLRRALGGKAPLFLPRPGDFMGASAPTVRRCARSAGSSTSPGWTASATAGGRSSARSTWCRRSSACAACGWWDWPGRSA